MTHTAILLNRYMDISFLYISQKIKPTLQKLQHIIAKCVPETNITLKYHIYATYAKMFM